MSDTVCPAFGLIDRATTFEGRFVNTDVNVLSRGVGFEGLDDLYLQGTPFISGAALSVLSLSRYADPPQDREEWQGDLFAANSHLAVQPGKVGLATFDWPLMVLRHPDSPQILVGERCSPKSGSWEVTREAQDETVEWIGPGPQYRTGAKRFDSGRQFTSLGVQSEPRIKDRDVLLIAPWRSPQADLLCAVKEADTQTVLTDDGDPFEGDAAHYNFADTFGLRVPTNPRNCDIYPENSGASVVSKIRLNEPGFYDCVFQATVGMLLKSAYDGYAGEPRQGGLLLVRISLDAGEDDWGDYAANAIIPSTIRFYPQNIPGEPVAEYAIRLGGDIGESQFVPFNEDMKRSVYMPFTCRVQRDAELSVRILIYDALPRSGGQNQYYDATVDNPSLLIEYIGPSDSREGHSSI
jgi:hypothetical protein